MMAKDKTPAQRTLAENVEVSTMLLEDLVRELRAQGEKLERSKAAIDAELDLIKTAEQLVRKIQRFNEHYVKDQGNAAG